ncbi:hypothetical protein TARUN_8425 [Trichoderma arundinaceum]|uniref:Uncharacterized protein n=1 Tax=Trichoderma arundinaceum TaxID=490622 RepID=A0A395NCW0_TRIAR|nr:hypothetical protein TARUN_8425 [Trichoderma arundinaceum]
MDTTTPQPPSTTETTSAAPVSSSSKEPASPPAPLSLYGIARLHCREEILISPLRWTGRHLELLQCSFGKPLPEPVTVAATSVTEADYTEEITGTPYLKEFFNFYYKALFREQGMRLLLTNDACPLFALNALVLNMNRSAVKMLPCVSFYRLNPDPASLEPRRPIAALVDRGQIEWMRKETLGGNRKRQCNSPILRLFHKKWKKVNPTDPLHDPYIVALLISLAQEKRRYLQEVGSDEEARTGMIPSQALCTFNSRGKCKEKAEEAFLGWMYLYKADIPSSLLDMFDHPSVPPTSSPSISIQVTTIYYSPLATLRARILELIMPGSVAEAAAARAARAAAKAAAKAEQEEAAEAAAAPSQSAGRKRKFDDEGIQQPSSRGAPPPPR